LGHINGIRDQVELHEGDITDFNQVREAIMDFRPTEIYNLAAQSFVGQSWGAPELYLRTNGIGFLNVLEAAKGLMGVRIYQASSSEQFGNAPEPQSEATRMSPESPYGVSKVLAHTLAGVYRRSYGMFVACGICFNHESPRRGPQFVSRKVSRAVAEIARNGRKAPSLTLGTLSAARDWGWAPDYVEAMTRILRYDQPDDFIIATGQSHTVWNWVMAAFRHIGIFSEEEVMTYIEHDEALKRPVDVWNLRGDPIRAHKLLGWYPSTSFEDMVAKMVDVEVSVLDAVQQGEAPA
jgi:GDPmannose 4,6-dehydratase